MGRLLSIIYEKPEFPNAFALRPRKLGFSTFSAVINGAKSFHTLPVFKSIRYETGGAPFPVTVPFRSRASGPRVLRERCGPDLFL